MPLPTTITLPGGLVMPAVGLGTFKSRGQEATSAVAAALVAGFRHIDTASIYKVTRSASRTAGPEDGQVARLHT